VLPNGTRSELAQGELSMPGGLALASDGTIYVTNWSVLPGGGQVLRIQQ
jgi:sugar lactone lactonase YvrE